VQRGHRDMVVIDGREVCILWRGGFATAKADPVIGLLAGIHPGLDRGGLQVIFALRCYLDTSDFGGRACREIHVDQGALRPASRDQPTDHISAVRLAGRPVHLPAAAFFIGLGEGDGRNAQGAAFHGAGDCSGIGDIVGHVRAAVDAGNHQVRGRAFQQVATHHHHAVRGRAGDGETPLVNLAQAKRRSESE
jgi:hypothetical protein